MPEVTISVKQEMVDALRNEANELGHRTLNDYITAILQRRNDSNPLRADPTRLREDYEVRLSEYERELNDWDVWIAELYEKLERAQRQLTDEPITFEERRQRKKTIEQRKVETGILTRIRWVLFGMEHPETGN